MTIEFSPAERAAMEALGLPVELESYVAEGFPLHQVRGQIKRELLGPGLGGDGFPNEYGDALRSALDTISYYEAMQPGPPEREKLVGEIRSMFSRVVDADEGDALYVPLNIYGLGIAQEFLEYLSESQGVTMRDVSKWVAAWLESGSD